MHLPFIKKMFEGCKYKIVPILVGSLEASKEEEYGEILAKYFD
jgi:AmmeMemoRadiSam system protein B